MSDLTDEQLEEGLTLGKMIPQAGVQGARYITIGQAALRGLKAARRELKVRNALVLTKWHTRDKKGRPMSDLTPEQIDRGLALYEKTTPDEWWNESGVVHAKNPGVWTESNHSCIHPLKANENEWDAEFAAQAHQLLPAALLALKVARKENAALKAENKLLREAMPDTKRMRELAAWLNMARLERKTTIAEDSVREYLVALADSIEALKGAKG